MTFLCTDIMTRILAAASVKKSDILDSKSADTVAAAPAGSGCQQTILR
jgi:hypothetical protein